MLRAWLAPRAPQGAPRVALGTMNFGGRTPESEALKTLAMAVERGVTLLDTANIYAGGESERIVGKFLAGHRGQALVATKAGLGRGPGGPEGLSAAALRSALEASLRRLGADRVDLFYLHAPDPKTPLDETLVALGALHREGKIGAWGVSNFASWQIVEMFYRCDALGVPRPAVSQVLYNALVRQLDLEYSKFRVKYGLSTTIYNPLAGGLLAGRLAPGAAPEPGSRFDKNALYQRRYLTDRMRELALELASIASDDGVSPVALAYRWLVGREVVDSVLVGPASAAHLDDALVALAAGPLPAATQRRVDDAWLRWSGTDASYAR